MAYFFAMKPSRLWSDARPLVGEELGIYLIMRRILIPDFLDSFRVETKDLGARIGQQKRRVGGDDELGILIDHFPDHRDQRLDRPDRGVLRVIASSVTLRGASQG